MRADGGHWRRSGALVLSGLLCGAVPAGAEGVYGSIQGQYQRLDEQRTFINADGSIRSERVSEEFWLRTIDLNQQSYLRPNLLLHSNLRYSERGIVDREDRFRTPTGVLRLVHPYGQLMASHQPAWTRTTVGDGRAAADATAARSVVSRNRESMLAGHFAPPNGPRVDLSWVQRRREAEGTFGDRNRTGSARVTLDRDRYSTYGAVTQQRVRSDQPGAAPSTQTVLAAGGMYRYDPRKDLTFRAQYDLTDALRSGGSGPLPRAAVSQNALFNGDWRPTEKWTGSTSLLWRRAESGSPNAAAQVGQEGSALARYAFSRRSSVLSGVGYRSVEAAGGAKLGYQKYVTSLLSADAPIRRRWTMSCNASHTTNWDPDRDAYGVQALTAATRGPLTRAIQADVAFQFTANGDSAAAGSRYSTGWSARLQGNPLRSLQTTVSLRNQRIGPRLLGPISVARGLALDVLWRPVPAMSVVGQYGATTSLPSTAGRTATRSLTVRWDPTARWQWYGSWTRSDRRTVVSTAGQLSSFEVVTTRLQYAPDRRLAANASLSYNEPGRALESRRLDLTLVWSFGR